MTVLNESAAAAVLPAEAWDILSSWKLFLFPPFRRTLGPLPTLQVLTSDALLVLTSFDEVLPAGQRSQTLTRRPIEVAVPAVDVTLMDLDTLRPIEVSLDRPMYVRIATVSPEPNWICVAWI